MPNRARNASAAIRFVHEQQRDVVVPARCDHAQQPVLFIEALHLLAAV